MLKRKFLFVFLIVLLASTFPYSIKAQEKTYLKVFEKDGTVLRIPTISLSDSVVSYQDTKDFYQFNITLSKPPVSNRFDFPIETAGLEFYYQPPLNEEVEDAKEYAFVNATHALNEKGEVVAYRPENVVGSYAVYRSDGKTGNQYTTGKLYHIYRPLIVDAKGASSWANLSVTKTGMTIIADTGWLAKAAYPVTIDPSFGYDSVGASDGDFSNYVVACKFTLSEDAASIENITWHGRQGSGVNKNAEGLLYDNDGGDINHLDGTTNTNVLPASGTWQWTTFTFASPPAESAGTYWLGAWCEYYYHVHYDAGATGQTVVNRTAVWNTPPNPFKAYTTRYDRKLSIYANYTAAGGAPQNVIVDLSQTIAVSSSLDSEKSLYREASQSLIIEETSISQKELFRIGAATLTVSSASVSRKQLYRSTSGSTSVTTIIETQKDINIHMIVEITGEILVSAVLEATKHIGATLIDLLGTAAISSTLQAILPIIPLTAEEAAFIGILFAVVVLVVCVALIYRRKKSGTP